tara:strand:+ start:444 stop:722 length:279 start_codon:yes stop_codon:yes gene_type:complete
MKAEIIFYSLGKVSDSQRSLFKRDFLGYTDRSNNGSYTYKREGFLSKIPHLKPSKGTLIVKLIDGPKVKKALKKYKSKIQSFTTSIDKSMLH